MKPPFTYLICFLSSVAISLIWGVSLAEEFSSPNDLSVVMYPFDEPLGGKGMQLLGRSFGDIHRRINIPANAEWYVEPVLTDPSAVDWTILATELKERGHQGLSLGAKSDLSVQNLKEIPPSFLEALSNCETLTRINLNIYGDDFSRLFEAIGKIKNLQVLRCSNAPLTFRHLSQVAELNKLTTLDVSGTKMSHEAIETICLFHKLTCLNVSNTKMTGDLLTQLPIKEKIVCLGIGNLNASPDELRTLSQFVRLEHLDVSNTIVNDELILELSSLGALSNLILDSTRVTDAGLARSGILPQLRAISLHRTQVGAKALRAFSQNTKLTSLGLSECSEINDASFSAFTASDRLVELNLSGTAVTNDALKQLSRSQELRHLNLSNTRVEDEGLQYLASCRKLQTVDLQSTNVTDQGLSFLKECTEIHSLQLGDAANRKGLSKAIGNRPMLRDLSLGVESIESDELCNIIKGCANLESFALLGKGANDSVMEELSHLESLRELGILESEEITVEGLKSLSHCKSLELLMIISIDRPDFSKAVNDLKKEFGGKLIVLLYPGLPRLPEERSRLPSKEN